MLLFLLTHERWRSSATPGWHGCLCYPRRGGSERRLTFDNRDLAGRRRVWLVGLTYTSDGRDIILGGNGLWRIHATGKATRAEPVRGLGFTALTRTSETTG